MFVQIIQGRIEDPVEVREAFDTWHRDLAPGADGWRGTTAGVTSDGELVALVRFDSAEQAMHNSHRPEQHQWWMETAKLFTGEITFHNCTEVDASLGGGGSDEAGFVQVIQGHSTDPYRLWELNARSDEPMRQYRPDILGSIAMLHDDGEGGVTEAVYFTTETEARAGEQRPMPPELAELWQQEESLFTDLRYYDLSEPWLYSPTQG